MEEQDKKLAKKSEDEPMEIKVKTNKKESMKDQTETSMENESRKLAGSTKSKLVHMEASKDENLAYQGMPTS